MNLAALGLLESMLEYVSLSEHNAFKLSSRIQVYYKEKKREEKRREEKRREEKRREEKRREEKRREEKRREEKRKKELIEWKL